MLSVMQSPSTLYRRVYDEIPQHPLERLRPLRIDIELRRSTFLDWPRHANVSAEILCDNGFYYMGIQDKVQCVFCGGILSGWSKDDDVQHEHARHFGHCELVRIKKKSCVRSFEFSNQVPSAEKQTSESNVKPHNSQYTLYSDRLKTFRLWQKSLKQTPEDLAATGLYYKGPGDKCQCYMCGGILSGWDSEDVPSIEHKKWFPKCPLNK